jgi:hypothetical protein
MLPYSSVLLNRLLTVTTIFRYRLAVLGGFRPSLTTLADYHATDKGRLHGYGSVPFPGHKYAEMYDALFDPIRLAPIRLLEIGIGIKSPGSLSDTAFGRNSGGASLKMWRDYFPHATIYGIDILSADFLNRDRLRTLIADQSSPESLLHAVDEIGVPLDIIIDDGSHASRHQQITLATLFPFVTQGGVYIIEDLHYQPPSLESPADVKTLVLLQDYARSSRFISPYTTADEAMYLESHIASCDVMKSRDGSSLFGLLRKK